MRLSTDVDKITTRSQSDFTIIEKALSDFIYFFSLNFDNFAIKNVDSSKETLFNKNEAVNADVTIPSNCNPLRDRNLW